MAAQQSVFDMSAVAQQYGMSQEALENMTNQARIEFGKDDMMVELHVIRAIRRTRFEPQIKVSEA